MILVSFYNNCSYIYYDWLNLLQEQFLWASKRKNLADLWLSFQHWLIYARYKPDCSAVEAVTADVKASAILVLWGRASAKGKI